MNSNFDVIEIFGGSAFVFLVILFTVYVLTAKLFLRVLKKESPEVYQYLDYPTVFPGFSRKAWFKKLDDPFYKERRTPKIMAAERRMKVTEKIVFATTALTILGVILFAQLA